MMNVIKMLVIAVAGIYLLVNPLESLYTVFYILGAAMILYGVCTSLAYIFQRGKKDIDEKDRRTVLSLLFGILAIACGLFLIYKPDTASEYFPIASGMFVLAAGILSSAEAVAHRKELAGWRSDLAFAIATVALGAILMYFKFDKGTTVRVLGTVLLYFGAVGSVRNLESKRESSQSESESNS